MPLLVVRSRRSFCETWGWCICSVVPELTEHLGAEHSSESWLGEVDVGVRVLFKILGQAALELGDLAVQFADDAHRAGGGGRRPGEWCTDVRGRSSRDYSKDTTRRMDRQPAATSDSTSSPASAPH